MTELELRERILKLIDKWNTQHEDWCCTKGCTYSNEIHLTYDKASMELAGAMWEVSEAIPCTGECNCVINLYLTDLRELLA